MKLQIGSLALVLAMALGVAGCGGGSDAETDSGNASSPAPVASNPGPPLDPAQGQRGQAAGQVAPGNSGNPTLGLAQRLGSQQPSGALTDDQSGNPPATTDNGGAVNGDPALSQMLAAANPSNGNSSGQGQPGYGSSEDEERFSGNGRGGRGGRGGAAPIGSSGSYASGSGGYPGENSDEMSMRLQGSGGGQGGYPPGYGSAGGEEEQMAAMMGGGPAAQGYPGMEGEEGDFGQMAGMLGGQGGPGGFESGGRPGGSSDAPDFSTPQGGAEAFLDALDARDPVLLREATSRRAPTEAKSKQNKEAFQAILEESLTAAELEAIAEDLDGYQISGRIPVQSSGTRTFILRKREDNAEYQRMIVVRSGGGSEREWKVRDVTKPLVNRFNTPPRRGRR